MRKFTSFMLTLLLAVTAWAGPTDLPEMSTEGNIKWYTIANTRSQSGKYLYWAGDDAKIQDSNTITEASLFYFTGTTDNCRIHNAATSNLFASNTSWTEAGTAVTITVTPHSSNAGLAIGFNSTYLNEQNYDAGYTTWVADDEGSIFVIAPIAANFDDAIAQMNANKEAGNTNLGTYKYDEEKYNSLATALNTLKSTTEGVWTAYEACQTIVNTLEIAMPEPGKFYVIEAPLFYNTQGVSKGLCDNEGSLTWNTIDLTNKAFYWQVEKVGSTYAIKNVATSDYIGGTAMSETAVYGNINNLGNSQFNIVINNVTLHTNGHGNGTGSNGNIVSWAGGVNSGSSWKFIERQDPDAAVEVTVTYNFTYNDETKYTQSAKAFVGDEYPAITTELPFGITAVKPEGVIEAEDVVEGAIEKEIALVVNTPFESADDYASINKWYYLTIGTNKHMLYHVEDADYIALTQTTVDMENADAYTWAFIGNAFDGYKIVNRAKGSGYILSSTTDVAGTDTGASVYPIMTAEENLPGSNNTLWVATKSNYLGGEGTFFLAQKGNNDNRMNNRDSKLAYWTGGADQGSTFMVTERDLTGTNELLAYIEQVETAIALYGEGGTTVGYLTAASTEALATALAATKAAVADPNRTFESNSAARANLESAVAALATIQPSSSKYYVIKSACQNDSRLGKMIYVNDNLQLQFAADGDAATRGSLGNMFQFVDAGDGKFYLYNVSRDKFLSTAHPHAGGIQRAIASLPNEASKVTITNMGSQNIVKIVPEGGAMIHAQFDNSVVVAWDNEAYDNGSAWILEEVEEPTTKSFDLTIGAAGYATLYVGCDVTIPAGVEAYTVSSVADGYVTLSAVSNAIPNNTGVILKKAEGEPEEANYSFNYATAADAVGENLLVGHTYRSTQVVGAYTAYVLANGESGVGLYKATLNQMEGTAFINNAHKAFLFIQNDAAESASYSFRFEGTTGVENVVVENGAEAIYDLTGRKVETINAAGIYIVNGKKVLVK